MDERIDSSLVVFKTSLIVPQNSIGRIGFSVESWNVEIEVSFEDQDNQNGQEILIEPNGNRAKMRFINWNNGLGSALKAPTHFATTNTLQRISFLAMHWRIGAANKLDLQFQLD